MGLSGRGLSHLERACKLVPVGRGIKKKDVKRVLVTANTIKFLSSESSYFLFTVYLNIKDGDFGGICFDSEFHTT